MKRTLLRLLLAAPIAGCGADSAAFVEFFEGINDAGAKILARDKAVVDRAKQDFRVVAPVVTAVVEAALGEEPGPVRRIVGMPDGTLMDLEISGMDGTGLVVGEPLLVTFAWSILDGPDEPRTGQLTLTLDADGTLGVSDRLSVPVACQVFKLTNLEMRFDPGLLPAFRPSGRARLEAIAEDFFVALEGDVTFDGAGNARVEGFVINYGSPHGADFSARLD